MRDVVPRIRARGAELVVVGSGSPEQAAEFQREQQLDFTLLVDPELKAYAAAGLRRGVRTTLRPGVLRSFLRARRGGFRQGKTEGDPWQQGGVFVITPDSEPRYAYVSQEPGDHPPPAEWLAVLPPG